MFEWQLNVNSKKRQGVLCHFETLQLENPVGRRVESYGAHRMGNLGGAFNYLFLAMERDDNLIRVGILPRRVEEGVWEGRGGGEDLEGFRDLTAEIE
ncbi:unnamed protein product [Prunus armeniaca]